MKKSLCYLMLMLSFVSFVSSASIKKEVYNPAGKELFIFNEYSSAAIKLNHYNSLYSSPNGYSNFYPSYKKYKGMEAYWDKDVKFGGDIYKKLILKNGEVFYISDFQTYDQLESKKNYEKRLNEIEKLKQFKFPNIDELSVTKVVTESKDVYIITFSDGLKLYNEQLDGLSQLSKKITNANDFRKLIDIIKTKNIYFTYDPIDNLAKIELDSDFLKMYLSVYQEKVYLTIVRVIFNSYDGIRAKNFKIYQNGNKYDYPNDITFDWESGSYIYEWHDFILNNEFSSYINSLDDSQDAIIRFYGIKRNNDEYIDSKSIAKMKKFLR